LDKKEQYRRAIKVLRQGGVAAMRRTPSMASWLLPPTMAPCGVVYESRARFGQRLPLFVGSIEQGESSRT